VTIGIIWINHHVMIDRLKKTDHTILILNLLLLMSIGIIPFATELMASYLRQPRGEAVAAAVYSGSFLVMSVLFATLNRHVMLRKANMLAEELPLEQRRRILSRVVTGLIPVCGGHGPWPLSSPYIPWRSVRPWRCSTPSRWPAGSTGRRRIASRQKEKERR